MNLNSCFQVASLYVEFLWKLLKPGTKVGFCFVFCFAYFPGIYSILEPMVNYLFISMPTVCSILMETAQAWDQGRVNLFLYGPPVCRILAETTQRLDQARINPYC